VALLAFELSFTGEHARLMLPPSVNCFALLHSICAYVDSPYSMHPVENHETLGSKTSYIFRGGSVSDPDVRTLLARFTARMPYGYSSRPRAPPTTPLPERLLHWRKEEYKGAPGRLMNSEQGSSYSEAF
jgi:hypothetical protein